MAASDAVLSKVKETSSLHVDVPDVLQYIAMRCLGQIWRFFLVFCPYFTQQWCETAQMFLQHAAFV